MSCLLSLIRKSKTVIKNCRDAMLQDPVDLAIDDVYSTVGERYDILLQRL